MEKSGRIQLTTEEFALFSQLRTVPSSVQRRWSFVAPSELYSMVETGNYEIVRDILPISEEEIPY